MKSDKLNWQSKLILLLVLPAVVCGVVFDTGYRLGAVPAVVYWTLGLSAALGILTLVLKAATPFAALTGAVITAQLMYTTSGEPYYAWRTFLVPVLAVALLAHIATRAGRARKEKLGTAEARHGRSASQVAANLGAAALMSTSLANDWAFNSGWLQHGGYGVLLIGSLAAMAEAAADTVSSEIGQAFGGRPRMITTLRPVEPGTDGGVTLNGTLAGIAAAVIVVELTTLAFGSGHFIFVEAVTGAVVGLFIDSLLGATFERKGWLNNDSVNFLSTISAGACALLLSKILFMIRI